MIFDIFNVDWAQTFSTLEGIMWYLIFYLIFLIIMALFLKLALSFFSKAKHKEFGQIVITAFILTIIYALTFLFLGGWLAWIIVLVTAWLIISGRHHTGFLGAIVVTVIAFILFIIVSILLVVLFGITLYIILI
ncbi:MAG: hypothetical protein CEE42_02250 [Promethearchaeota archaeon Loki_b31]|nr:MAG: hypothetical protein CEE42_02250 [Candidatus Lokiarchaeota archaeon Loki_b31]